MCMSSPKAPPPPPRLPEAARLARPPQSTGRARPSAGTASTIVTGSKGLTEEASTAKKTLLGG